MKSVKQIATKGLRHIEKRHRNAPDYAMMKRGHEYIRDNPEKFALGGL